MYKLLYVRYKINHSNLREHLRALNSLQVTCLQLNVSLELSMTIIIVIKSLLNYSGCLSKSAEHVTNSVWVIRMHSLADI